MSCISLLFCCSKGHWESDSALTKPPINHKPRAFSCRVELGGLCAISWKRLTPWAMVDRLFWAFPIRPAFQWADNSHPHNTHLGATCSDRMLCDLVDLSIGVASTFPTIRIEPFPNSVSGPANKGPVIGFLVEGYQCLMHLRFVVWVILSLEDAIPEGRKPSKTSCSKKRKKPDCEWACHVPPSLWWHDACIWTNGEPKPSPVFATPTVIWGSRWSFYSEVTRNQSHWLPRGLFLLHLAWSTNKLWSPNFVLCCCCSWVAWN